MLPDVVELPKTANQVRDVLAETLMAVRNRLRNRPLDARIASTLAYVAGSLLGAIKSADYEERLAKLECLAEWEHPSGER